MVRNETRLLTTTIPRSTARVDTRLDFTGFPIIVLALMTPHVDERVVPLVLVVRKIRKEIQQVPIVVSVVATTIYTQELGLYHSLSQYALQ